MVFDPVQLARPAVRALKPYSSARSATAPGGGRILLDANELGGGGPWSRYPEPQPERLKAKLAARFDVPPEALFLGRGADEAIDSLVRVFCEAGEGAIVVTPPTYGFYAVAAAVQGARVLEAPLVGRAFDLDGAAILDRVAEGATLAFVCNPNNPTGNAFDPARLVELAAALLPSALLVVDEAYVDFTDRGSLVGLAAREGSNLVVLRTLSKAWGLAGVRLGVAVADPRVVALLNKVRAPYPLSAPATAAALGALDELPEEALAARVAGVVGERTRLAKALAGLPAITQVFPSETNYLLVRCADADAVLARCAAAGIVIRDRRSEPALAGCVRISVGTREENDALLRALEAP